MHFGAQSRIAPIRVLHIVTSAEDSAAQVRIILSLSRRVNPSEFEIHCCFVNGRGNFTDRLRAAGVQTYDLAAVNLHKPTTMLRLFALLRRGKFSIIHDHHGAILGRIIARAAGCSRIVLHVHSRLSEKGGVRPELHLLLYDELIATSGAVARTLHKQSQVVHPGVERLVCDKEKNPNCNSIGTVARLESTKGVDTLIRAMDYLRLEFPDLHLEIVGSGSEADNLKNLVQDLGLEERVVFSGWHDVPWQLASSWKIFIAPSNEEGFGLAILEAMAIGLPVIATDVGGIPEMIVDEETGLLVPKGDSRALASRISSLLRADDLRDRISLNARRIAECRFSADVMTGKIVSIYRSMLGR